MLDAEYLKTLTDKAEKISADMHTAVLTAVIERLKARIARGDAFLTSTDKAQIETLTEAGILITDVQKEIAKATELQKAEIRKIFIDAGIQATRYDKQVYADAGIKVGRISKSPLLMRLLQRGYTATEAEFWNLTKTTAKSAYNTFIKECDMAYNLVTSGAATIDEAYTQAVNRLAKAGIQIQYDSGHYDTIETATLRAIRTGVSQATGEITAQRAFESGITCFVTSSHRGARPQHEPWQGKVFWVDWKKMPQGIALLGWNADKGGFMGTLAKWLKGMLKGGKLPKASAEEKEKYDEFVESTGYGTMLGLCGINCRHTFAPWIEGVSKNNYPQYPKDENDKQYDIQQRQRELERRIRRTKRELEALKTAVSGCQLADARQRLELQIAHKKAVLERQVREYYEYCDKFDLKPEEMRLQIADAERAKRLLEA